jgi:23S rRNA pseudouridine2605 synthase
MGKQHSSEDKPGRRGQSSSGRPSGNKERGGYESRGNGARPSGGGRSEGYSPARPTFGQGGSKFGGRPSGGSDDRPNRSSFGGDRPNRGGFSGGGDRPNRSSFGSGDRPNRSSFGGGGDRPNQSSFSGGDRPNRGNFGGASSGGEKRSFGGDRDARPRRFEQAGEASEGRGREERGERSERPAKPIWQGQPVRYEGKPTVPRGATGERNRKFIKRNPDGSPVEGGESRPAYTGRDERRSFEERGAGNSSYGAARPRPEGSRDERRDDRPARKEYGQRPSGDDRRSEGGRSSYGGASDSRPPRREGDERRSYGDRDSRSAGDRDSRSTGDRREGGYGGARKYEGDRSAPRAAGSFDKPRSYGERPANAGGTGSGTFRERREAMKAQMSGPRSSTGYGRTSTEPGQAPDYKNLKHYEDDKNRGNKRRRDEEDFGTEELRLNRYIANAGICSRREADALIAAGEIRVNGEVITEMGYKVQPTDTVQYGKTNLNREKLVYVLLNKPKDFITTTDDPEGRKTVMSLVATASKERIFPVGRLDRNTTGLLLFTNDGEVAQKLSHPSHQNKKIYQAELDKPLTAEHLAQIAAGLELEDGKAEVDDVAVVAGNPHFVGIELHIGRNRIVRRIFEHLGYDVVALDRVQYAGLTKKELPRGKWRFLNEQEVIRLKYFM